MLDPRELRRLAMLAAVLCLGLACDSQPPAPAAAPAATAAAPAPPPPPELVRIPVQQIVERLHQGIDVSGHSGNVEWPKVAAEGHGFAFIKATEGMDLEDPAFDLHWPLLKEAGLVRGAYHFFVTEDDPEIQAQFFIDTVSLEPGDLAPVVDVELLGHNTEITGLPERLRTFLGRLEQHYGVKPIIYTAPNFWNQYFDDGFSDHPLWVAEYGVTEPRIPIGWSSWHLWQWKGDAEVPGVEKTADLSRINLSAVDLSSLVIP